MAENRVIGFQGKIPWHLPEDFKWFKKMTLGGAVIMGRKTFESLGRPLPGRENVVLSREGREFSGVRTVRCLEEVLEQFGGNPDSWIIGGAELYAQTLPFCSDLFLSAVHGNPEGDAFFPPFEHLFREGECIAEHVGFSICRYQNLRAVP